MKSRTITEYYMEIGDSVYFKESPSPPNDHLVGSIGTIRNLSNHGPCCAPEVSIKFTNGETLLWDQAEFFWSEDRDMWVYCP